MHKNQLEADKRYREKNREHTNYLKKRSTSRSFIKNNATLDDLEELEGLIKSRREELSNKT